MRPAASKLPATKLLQKTSVTWMGLIIHEKARNQQTHEPQRPCCRSSRQTNVRFAQHTHTHSNTNLHQPNLISFDFCSNLNTPTTATKETFSMTINHKWTDCRCCCCFCKIIIIMPSALYMYFFFLRPNWWPDAILPWLRKLTRLGLRPGHHNKVDSRRQQSLK